MCDSIMNQIDELDIFRGDTSVSVLECYPPLNQDGSEKNTPFAVGKKIYTKMEVTKDHHSVKIA